MTTTIVHGTEYPMNFVLEKWCPANMCILFGEDKAVIVRDGQVLTLTMYEYQQIYYRALDEVNKARQVE
jgi:hypothetical protein